jgi:hypothetical protein
MPVALFFGYNAPYLNGISFNIKLEFQMKIKRYWHLLKAQKRPIKFLIGKILMKFGLSQLFYLKREGFILRFYPSSISLALWLDPSKAPSSAEIFFRRYIRPDDVVIDAGANIGFFTLVSSVLVGDFGKVYAIEPHPRAFKYLEGNVAINKCKNVYTYNIALGDKNGTINFTNKKTEDDQNFIQTGS